MKEVYVKICPKCGSDEIGVDFSNLLVWVYGTTVIYKCNQCGHRGDTFPEMTKKSRSYYKRELKEKSKEVLEKDEVLDTSPGYFIGMWQTFFSLVTIIVMIPLFLDGVDKSIFLVIAGLWTIFFVYLLRRTRNARIPRF